MQKRLFRFVIIPAAALMAAGCAPALVVRTPSAVLPQQYEQSEGADVKPAALDRWWTLFGDAQLNDLIARALTTGTDAKLALARLREARAIRESALAQFRLRGDPEVTGGIQRSETLAGPDQLIIGGAGGGANVSGTTAASVAPSYNLSWELDLFGRRSVATRAADADLAAAQFEYEASRASLAAEVADALFAARGLAAQIDDAGATIRIQRDLLRIVTIRSERGLAAHSEAARIDADVAQTEAQATALSAELTATRRAILVLLGEADRPIAALEIKASLDEPPAPPPSVPGTLLQRRPDVRQAEQQLRAAIARAEFQRLELFPRLTLNPGTGLTATRVGGENSVSAVWTLGAGLLVPILDRSRLLAETRAETARAEQAVIGYERAVQTAFSEADQALVRLAADRARIVSLTRAEQQSNKALAAARLLFGRGLSDLPSVLDAERSERNAGAALATARTEALRRTVTVFRALGGGWDSAAAMVPAEGGL